MSSHMLSADMRSNCKESPPSLDLPYLPDDTLLNCLARISRLYYPTLSLISKRFRSLIASIELYKTRALLGCTESCLYFGLRYFLSDDLRWYTLCWRPTQIPNPPSSGCFTLRFDRKKDKKSSNNFAVYVTARNYNYPKFYGKYIAVGSYIYMIGGGNDPSSSVFFMDCRSHTWYEAPSLAKARIYLELNLLDGKIFVMEEEADSGSLNLIECFDPKTEKWEDIPSPGAYLSGEYVIESLVMNGDLYTFADKDVVYKPKENRWDAVKWFMDLSFTPFSSCMIDNVLYNYGYKSSGKGKMVRL